CLRPHVHDGFENRQHSHGFANAFWWLGLTEKCERLAHLAKLFGLAVHAHGNAIDSAKEIAENRHLASLAPLIHRILKKNSWSALGEKPRLDFGHFKIGRDGLLDTHELAFLLEPGHEIPQ